MESKILGKMQSCLKEEVESCLQEKLQGCLLKEIEHRFEMMEGRVLGHMRRFEAGSQC